MKQTSVLARMTVATIALLGLLTAFAGPSAIAQSGPKVFSSPTQAAAALVAAIRLRNNAALVAVLGPATKKWIISGDPVRDRQARAKFIADYEQKHTIEMKGKDKAVLVIGNDGYPFAFPIVRSAAGWAFDPEQGREEILNRRVGENEIKTIQVMKAIADAQLDYASEDRNGDNIREYAMKFKSSPGKRDGLHWPTKVGEPPSPLGELVVRATAEGYKLGAGATKDATGAYHGYRFRLLMKQGSHAKGGRYDYVVKGSMIGGFGVLAYPVKYAASGVMTFITNQDGVVFETDLGPNTETKVKAISSFDPGPGWKQTKTD